MESEAGRHGGGIEVMKLPLDAPRAPAYVAPPQWFLRAVAAPTTSHFVDDNGTRLHYRCWNAEEADKPPLLFVHGFKGHSHWWDFIAPYFVDRFRVLAMDFAGMGESGHRAAYDTATFTGDLIAVLEQCGGPVVVVGHSYGGGRALRVCADRPELIRRAVILDSRIRYPDVDTQPPRQRMGSGRPYASYGEARARYRVFPEQPVGLPDALEHVAFHSIARVGDGFRWRFDPALPTTGTKIYEADGGAVLDRVETPIDFVHGAESVVVEPWRAARTVARLQRCRGPIAIPECRHHLMLDQPLALIAVLKTLLADNGGDR